MINYTVIIPHKNRIDLLKRCIHSIPKRDDVEIIIVDDNSNPNIVDFNKFPGKEDKHIELIFTKEGKGAGFARNIGLSYAKGKWIIFADSDDYYLDNINVMMDDYLDSDADMIIFKHIRVDENGKEKINNYTPLFDDSLVYHNYEKLILNFYCPWGRFIKRDFIEKNNIKFQEVRYSNDVMFSLKCGLLSDNIKVIDRPIYCVCEIGNSLMRNNSWKSPYVRTKVGLDVYTYIINLNRNVPKDNSWKTIWESWWLKTFKMNKFAAIYLIPRIIIVVGPAPFFSMFKNKLTAR